MKATFFICFLITFTFSCSSKTTTTTGSINWWCTQTPYYQTCTRYIAEGSPSTANISINQFLDITVNAAIDEARVVQKRTQGIEARTNPNSVEKILWHSCADFIDGMVFTLNMVLDHTHQPSPDDIHTWISASLTYIDVCEKEFEIMNITTDLLPEVTTNLTQLLLNSLAISVVIKGANPPGLHELNFGDELYNFSGLKTVQPDVVVAKDGSGNFTTVQEAVNSRGQRAWGQRYTIYVKSGVYEENVVIPHEAPFITMYGDGIGKTIITGNRHDTGELKNTSTFQVWGRRFIALHLTFQNTAGPEGGPAVAFLSGSDTSTVYQCSIEGYQDTLFTFNSRQFYKECQIYGTIDFIFGASQAVFQDCDIFLRKPRLGGGLVVTANGRKRSNQTGGYSLQGCKINVADDLKPVVGQYKKAFLGRPWFAYARTVYMQSFLDDLVDPQGWLDSWGYNQTAYCGEYKNSGPGSSTDQRVNWPGYQAITDPNIANQFTVAEFINGTQWLPTSGVPFVPGFENQ
ncbi:putative pectinesterase [Helianthus annuus]|nr:putative pectinesterase [Helianthus annuus]KAJ0842466.1 putative pectinesterase [Helianthus annuus]